MSSKYNIGFQNPYTNSASNDVLSAVGGFTTAGIFTVNGNPTTTTTISGGSFYMHVPFVSGGTGGAFNLVGSSSGAYQNIINAGDLFHVTGNDNTQTRITFDGFGLSATNLNPNQNAYPNLILRSARGTVATPSGLSAGDVLGRITFNGYQGSSYLPPGSAQAQNYLQYVATSNYTASAASSQVQFWLAPTGTNQSVLALALDSYALSSNNIEVNPGNAIIFSDNSVQTTAFYQLTGTWTPKLSSSTNGSGISATNVTSGVYIKTGKQVYCTFIITLSSIDASSGNVYLYNLPYPVAIGNTIWGDCRVTSFAASNVQLIGIVGDNSGSLQNFTLYGTYRNSGGGSNNLQVSDLGATAYLKGAINYVAAY